MTKLLCLLSVMFVFKLHAQVITSTFSPEVIINSSSEPYAFDFNSDGEIELYFLVQDLNGDTTISGIPATYDGTVAILGCQNGMPAGVTSSESEAFDLSLFNDGDELTVFQEYGSDTSYILGINLTVNSAFTSFPYQSGTYLGNQGYLGVMFDISGNTHLGWIDVSVSSDGSQITLYSYGYDASQGGNPLVIENATTNVNEITPQDVDLNIDNNKLQVYLKTIDASAKLKIVDATGKTRLFSTVSNLQNEFDLNDYEQGLYIVYCELKGAIYTKKIILN